ncbi:MAG: TP901 family phage tail tape measure protein [Desulforhopalus sp.]|jgi:TP901 family phage tail tape measure protein
MNSAKKFVYTLQAVYEGKNEVKQLSADLKELKSIDAFEKMQKSFATTNKEFASAKAKLRELKTLMKQPGGDAYAASYEKARVNVEKLSASVVKQKTKLLEASSALKKSGVDVGNLTGRYKELQSSTQKQGNIMAAQAKLGVKSTQQIEREVASLERAYKDLRKSGVVSLKDLSAYKKKMNGDITKLRSGTANWRTGIDSVRDGWIGVVGVVATLAGTLRGIKFTADFDDSMRSVKAVSGATASEYEKLKGFAKDLGETTRFTASEAAAGMGELAQSGMSVNEIFKTLPQAMDLSSISGGSIKESADLITDTLKQFNLEVSASGRVTDVLVKGYTQASTSLDDLGKALSYAGPIASSFGYSLEDTVGILDALAEAGFKGSRGGTALVGGLTRLVKPAGEAAVILEKYGIQVYDTGGKLRDFADIMDDVGKASLNPTEMMTVFGQEAGPGMAGLLGQGSDAIRKFQGNLLDVGGIAERIAGDKEAGIGGALRSLGSSLQAIVLSFGDAFVPAITGVAVALTGLARLVTAMPESIKILTGTIALGVAGLSLWYLGLNKIFAVIRLGAAADIPLMITKVRGLILALRGVNVAALGAAGSVGAFAGGALALFAGYSMGKKIDEWEYLRDVVDANKDALGAVPAKLAAISSATGVTVTSMDELFAAQKKGLLQYDDISGEWVKATRDMSAAADASATAQHRVFAQAAANIKSEYVRMAGEVKGLLAEISMAEANLAGGLREMQRSVMTPIQAWRDLKAEADEYYESGEKAAAAGDFAEAKKLFGEAQSKYKSLNTEIKKGDKTILSQKAALEVAAEGYEKSGKKIIAALTSEKDAAIESMDDLAEKAGPFAEEWDSAFNSFLAGGKAAVSELEKEIDKLIEAKTLTLTIKTVEQKQAGGLIGQQLRAGGAVGPQHLASGGRVHLRNMLSGGHFAGYGGGDRRHVVAEDGEVMLRKESVRAAGLPAALAFNAGRFDLVVKELTKRFDLSSIYRATGGMINRIPQLSIPSLPSPQMLTAGGQVQGGGFGGDTYNMTFSFAGNVSQPSQQNAKELATMVMGELQRMHRGGSK